MTRSVFERWNLFLSTDNHALTRLFTASLYIFLLIKILLLLPTVADIVTYYKYHSASVVKQMVIAPATLARQAPEIFLILTGMIVTALLFVKRTYYFNALVFWLSLNVTNLCEPVANGADYVLNLMLLLSIPLASKPFYSQWTNVQPVFFKVAVLLIQVHVALIYLLSGFDKLMTPAWRSGETISYIAALDYYVNPVVPAIQSATVDPIIAWFTIVFELAFPIFIWFKNFRNVLLIIGVIFHVGIIYFLNLPDFGSLMIICYAIFLTRKPKLET